MYEEILYIALTVLMSATTTYLMGKYLVSDERIMSKLEMILNNLVNDVEMQKKVYLLGTLLGSGIAKGSGIQGSGGKFKLEDVIAQGASAFIGQMFRQPTQQTPQGGGGLP